MFNIVQPSQRFYSEIKKQFITTLTGGVAASLLIYSLIGVIPVQATGDIAKKGIDQTTQSTTQTAPNREIKWVIDYKNSTGATESNVTVIDPIPVDTNYVAGSVQAPTGFTTEYSTDGGSTWLTTEPASGVTHIRFTGANITSPATSITDNFKAAASEIQTGVGGGDGYQPILYKGYVCASYHHWPNPDEVNWVSISCFDKYTGITKPNYPSFFSSTSGVPTNFMGNGSSNPVADILTANKPHYSLIGGKLYYAAQRIADSGIACWNIELALNCGYTALSNTPPANLNLGNIGQGRIGGVANVGNKVYATVLDKLLCLDASTMLACVGSPYDLTSSGIDFAGNPSIADDNSTQFAIQNRYLFTSHWGKANCWDTVTNAICSNWVGLSANVGRAQFKYYNTSTSQYEGVCGITAGVCFKIDGTSVPIPNWFDVWNIQGQYPGYPGTAAYDWYSGENVGSRVFFSDYQVSTTVCYDFAIPGKCTGFGQGDFWSYSGTNLSNKADRADYATAHDQETNCMYGLGHQAVLWTFDAITGATPCKVVAVNIKYTQTSLYCDGSLPTSIYGKVKYLGNQSALNGVSTLPLSIKDKNGLLIKIGNLKTTGEIDISDIPYGTSVSYGAIAGLNTTELSAAGFSNQSGSPALNGQVVTIILQTLKDPQICFNTTVTPNPIGNSITNMATLNNGTNTFSATASLSLVVTADMSLTKISSGGGNSTNGTIGKIYQGSTVTYTLVATNNGSANANGNIVVVDTIPIGLTPLINNGTNYTGSPNWICQYTAPNMTCTNTNSMANGTSATVVLTAKVN